MNRPVFVSFVLGGFVVSSFGATVVHDAGRDLMLNSSFRSVCTNRYGGVWSFMQGATQSDITRPPTERTLLPGVRRYETTEKDSGGRNVRLAIGPSASTDGTTGNPTIAVNPTKMQDAEKLSKVGYPAAQPGQISLHTGDKQCAIIRFTVPRDGRYAVESKYWNQNDGVIGMVTLTNGVAPKAREAWTGSKHKGEVYDFSIPAADYRAGDLIEAIVDGNGTYNANATGVKFAITEEVLEVVDLAPSLRENVKAGGTAEWSTPFGRFNAQAAASSTSVDRDNLTAYERSTQGGGLKGFGCYDNGTVGHPSWTVEPDGNFATENGNIFGYALHPEEVLCFPGSAKPAVIRWTPAVSGTFGIGVQFRDLQANSQSGKETVDGVDVRICQGGETLATATASCEHGPTSTTIYLPDVTVFAGLSVEIVVDSRGMNPGDSTGVSAAFVQRCAPRWNVNAAVEANMASASPTSTFTADGATWALGSSTDTKAFAPYTVLQDVRYDTVHLFGSTQNTSPFFGVNVGERSATGYPDSIGMLFAHPPSDGQTTLRFTAPEKGLYSFACWVKDINGGGDVTTGAGVELRVLAHGCCSAAEKVVAEPVSSHRPIARLAADGLYLNAGDALDFWIDRNGAHSSDLTGLYAWIDKADASAKTVVNVNLAGVAQGEQPIAFSGAGRVGFSTAWNEVKVSDGAEDLQSKQLHDTDGARTGVRLAVARANGSIKANASNLSQANDLIKSGVVSESTADVYTFVVSGLVANSQYELHFYGRSLRREAGQPDVAIPSAFTVQGETVVSSGCWFTWNGDHASLTATADADGVITGTFANTVDDVPAYWNGLQVVGSEFGPYCPNGFLILVK